VSASSTSSASTPARPDPGRLTDAGPLKDGPGIRTKSSEPRVVEARGIFRRFGAKTALAGLDLAASSGEIHALLGPNGAGKTTLLRILTGLVRPDEGSATILGIDTWESPRSLRSRVGLVPSGDRSLYLRISGFENLVFFGRMHGMRRREAARRARDLIEVVGLAEAAHRRTGFYSHGMQKRLSIARALLTEPSVLLVDEATHDLDPEGAARVRGLVQGVAERGAAVVWATQRVEEIRGFCEQVTLLDEGRVRFQGTVPQLVARSVPRRYLLRLRNGSATGRELGPVLRRAVDRHGTIGPAVGGDEHDFLLALEDDAVLGEALAALHEARVQVLACREERSDIETAFLDLTGERQ